MNNLGGGPGKKPNARETAFNVSIHTDSKKGKEGASAKLCSKEKGHGKDGPWNVSGMVSKKTRGSNIETEASPEIGGKGRRRSQ